MSAQNKIITTAAALLLALSVAACNQSDAQTASDRGPAPVAACSNCGTVSNIEEVRIKGEGSGAGAVAGAIIGGVIGHQVGGGRGKDVATVAGAAGGAYAGHESEKRYNASTEFRVTIAMESGGTRTIQAKSLNGAGIGSKVKVSGNSLQLI